jgi:uncharacterized protein (DUF934 family)
MAKIIKDKRLQDDAWQVLPLSEEQTPEALLALELPENPVLVPLALWRLRADELCPRANAGTLGVWLAPGDDPKEIADDVDNFAVIGVSFPKFADGRGFSTGRLLRERYGYKGELRAFGDISRDQLFYLSRVGFNSFVFPAGRDAEDALPSFNDFPETYQGATDRPDPLFRRRVAALSN